MKYPILTKRQTFSSVLQRLQCQRHKKARASSAIGTFRLKNDYYEKNLPNFKQSIKFGVMSAAG